MDGEMAAYAGLGQFVITVTGRIMPLSKATPWPQTVLKRNTPVNTCLPRNQPHEGARASCGES